MTEGEYIDWETFLEKNKEIVFIVGSTQLKNILKDLGNDVDSEGFIIDSETGERIESYDLDTIKLKNLGLLSSGSKIFVKNSIANLSEYLSEKGG